MFRRHLIISVIVVALWMIIQYVQLFLFRNGAKDVAGFIWQWQGAIIGTFSFLLFVLMPPTFKKWPYVFTYILTMPVLLAIFYWLGRPLSYSNAEQKETALAIGSIMGYLYARSRPSVYRYVYPALLISVSILCYVSILPWWRHYCLYGIPARAISEEIPDGWYVYNERKETFNKNDWKDKTVIINIWNKDCVPCTHRLPQWQKFYDEHKGENMLIEAVHVPFFNRDLPADSGFYYARRKGYNFPVLIGSSSMLDYFKVNSIPTVIVLRHNKIAFKGRIEQLSKFLSKKQD